MQTARAGQGALGKAVRGRYSRLSLQRDRQPMRFHSEQRVATATAARGGRTGALGLLPASSLLLLALLLLLP